MVGKVVSVICDFLVGVVFIAVVFNVVIVFRVVFIGLTILFLVDNGTPSRLRLNIFVLVGDVDVVDVEVNGRLVVVDDVVDVGAAVDVVVDDDVDVVNIVDIVGVVDVVGIDVDVVVIGVDVAADVESLSVVVSITSAKINNFFLEHCHTLY